MYYGHKMVIVAVVNVLQNQKTFVHVLPCGVRVLSPMEQWLAKADDAQFAL